MKIFLKIISKIFGKVLSLQEIYKYLRYNYFLGIIARHNNIVILGQLRLLIEDLLLEPAEIAVDVPRDENRHPDHLTL